MGSLPHSEVLISLPAVMVVSKRDVSGVFLVLTADCLIVIDSQEDCQQQTFSVSGIELKEHDSISEIFYLHLYSPTETNHTKVSIDAALARVWI